MYESEFVEWKKETQAQSKRNLIGKIFFLLFLICSIFIISKILIKEKNAILISNIDNIGSPI